MSSPGVPLYLDQELLALILHGYHHHVGLVDQVRGGSEHRGGLPLLRWSIIQWGSCKCEIYPDNGEENLP